MLAGQKLFSALVVVLLICVVCSCSPPATPESQFKELFADLSFRVPEYQVLHKFMQPLDVVKGDFCTADFSQSQSQFQDLVAQLGTSREKVLSSSGVSISASSKLNPNYPWELSVRADGPVATNKFYEVHIEGRQPYN
jgi:hypothetical protein